MSLTCVWNMGSPCSGGVSSQKMFSSQIEVPVCELHQTEHLTLMTLNVKYKKDIEELLLLSAQERSNLLATLTSDVTADLKEMAEKEVTPYKAPETEQP